MSSPVLCFLHIPKTAGSTLRAWLENHLPHDTSLVMPEGAAAPAPEALAGRCLLSGHYASDTLRLVARKSCLRLAVIRDPYDRFVSWAAHSARLQDPGLAYRAAAALGTEVFHEPHAYELFQSHWLHRALRGDAADTRLPAAEELPGLLDEVDLVGTTEHLDRFMQLVAFSLGWTPPPSSWRLNRAPKPHAPRADAADIRSHLALDQALYDHVASRFAARYAAMLNRILPGRDFSGVDAFSLSFDTVQDALRAYFEESAPLSAVDRFFTTADSPLQGEGWWWREKPLDYAYRWSGPEPVSTFYLPALQPGQSYTLLLEFMAVASNAIWDSLEVRCNDRAVSIMREFLPHAAAHEPKYLVFADLEPAMLVGGVNCIELRVSSTVQALSETLVSESLDTVNRDLRPVALCLHSVGCFPRAA